MWSAAAVLSFLLLEISLWDGKIDKPLWKRCLSRLESTPTVHVLLLSEGPGGAWLQQKYESTTERVEVPRHLAGL